jgi:hypothetical protein
MCTFARKIKTENHEKDKKLHIVGLGGRGSHVVYGLPKEL